MHTSMLLRKQMYFASLVGKEGGGYQSTGQTPSPLRQGFFLQVFVSLKRANFGGKNF